MTEYELAEREGIVFDDYDRRPRRPLVSRMETEAEVDQEAVDRSFQFLDYGLGPFLRAGVVGQLGQCVGQLMGARPRWHRGRLARRDGLGDRFDDGDRARFGLGAGGRFGHE